MADLQNLFKQNSDNILYEIIVWSSMIMWLCA